MLVDLLFIVAAIGLIIAIYKIKFSNAAIEKQIQQAIQNKKQTHKEDIKQPTVPAQRATTQQETREAEAWQGEDSDSEQGSQGEDQVLDVRKQLRKQQKEKQKQQRKQAHEQYLLSLKQKQQKYEKDAQERERQEQQRRRKQDQIVEQLREQQRKRKQQQFNKWKNMFSVQEEGKQRLSEQEQRRKIESLNRDIVAVLRKNKLSLLEDLSHKFKLSTKDMVSKIQELEQSSSVSGIFDERGKYLVIEEDEWQSIKSYINARGRVKKTDIMTECAKLIKIPDYVEEDLLQLVKEGEAVEV